MSAPAGRTGSPATSLKAAQQAKATDLVTLGEGDQRITLQWKGGLPAPRLEGTRAEYVNAVPGADVVVEATRTGFEQFVEIKRKPASDGYSYTLPLKAPGLKVRQQADGSVLFTDGKNTKTALMPAPVMWDATVDPVSGEHTRRVPVGMKVVAKGSSFELVVTPDAEFLADPATKYPVTVDPSTSALSNVFDTYVQQGEIVDWSAQPAWTAKRATSTGTKGNPGCAAQPDGWVDADVSTLVHKADGYSLQIITRRRGGGVTGDGHRYIGYYVETQIKGFANRYLSRNADGRSRRREAGFTVVDHPPKGRARHRGYSSVHSRRSSAHPLLPRPSRTPRPARGPGEPGGKRSAVRCRGGERPFAAATVCRRVSDAGDRRSRAVLVGLSSGSDSGRWRQM